MVDDAGAASGGHRGEVTSDTDISWWVTDIRQSAIRSCQRAAEPQFSADDW